MMRTRIFISIRIFYRRVNHASARALPCYTSGFAHYDWLTRFSPVHDAGGTVGHRPQIDKTDHN